MAIKQTDLASGKLQAPQAFTSGVVSSFLASYTVTGAALEADDIIEFGPLPVGCRLISATVRGDSAASIGGLGLMSGAAGSQDPDRTIETPITEGSEHTIAPAAVARGIGGTVSAQVAVGETIYLDVLFAQL